MGDTRRYSDRDWLEKEIRAGKFPEQIAKSCGVTTQTIEQWVKKHSITPYQDKEWLETQLSNYIPPRTIAEWCCVTEQTIERWMKRFDLGHPGRAPPEVLQSHIEKRLEPFGDEFTIPKKWQIEELHKRYRVSAKVIAEVLDSNRRYVYQTLSGYTPQSKSDPISATLRTQILSRDEHQCVRCGASEAGNLQLHHLIPGESSEENLATLCFECHLAAHGGNFSGSTAYDSREQFWEDWIKKK